MSTVLPQVVGPILPPLQLSSPSASPETPNRVELQSLLDRSHVASETTTVAHPHEVARHARDHDAAALRAQRVAHLQLQYAAPLLSHTQDDMAQEAHIDLEDRYGHKPSESAVAPSVQSTNKLLGVMAALNVALLLFAGGLMWIAASHQRDEQIDGFVVQRQQAQQQELIMRQATPLQAAISLPEYRLTVVYFAHLMDGWEGILNEQLTTASNIGLGDAAEVHVVLSAPTESFLQLDQAAEATLSAGEKLAKLILPECSVHLHAGNRHEYPGLRQLWDLGQHSTHDPSRHFFLYFHAKGMRQRHDGHRVRHQLMNTTVAPWRAIVARFIEDPELHKQGHMTSLQGFMWFNFYWLRGSYLRDLVSPIFNLTDPIGRYYHEGWSSYLRVGSTLAGACTTPCNWSSEVRQARTPTGPITQIFPCFGPGIDPGTGTLVGCHSGPSAARCTCGDAHWKRGEVVSPGGGNCTSTPLLKDQPDVKQFTGDTRPRIRVVRSNHD